MYRGRMESRIFDLSQPFDLRGTLRTLGVGSLDHMGTWWWASDTSAGAATISLAEHANGIHARAWGQGAGSLLDRVPRLVSAYDTYSIETDHQRLRDILARTRGLRLGSTGAVHEAVVGAVLGQVVTKTEGKRSLCSIVEAFGDHAPGPNRSVRLFPAPDLLANLSYDELHSHGVERKRAATLIEVSRRSRRLVEVLTMDVDDAQRRLLAIRGIGPWTAALVMGQAYGDRDAIPVGDYHLPNLVAWALAGEPRGDDARMLELLEPHRPHRRHVLMAIKQSGIKAPRYGPRTAVRNHL